jgi:hypothetical protein
MPSISAQERRLCVFSADPGPASLAVARMASDNARGTPVSGPGPGQPGGVREGPGADISPMPDRAVMPVPRAS